MIVDRIENAQLYYSVHTKFKRAFEYVRQLDIDAIAVGKYEIDGESIFALVQHYNTKLQEQGSWEAHRRYIDLQYVAQGVEAFGYANIHRLQQGEYDTAKDFLPLEGEGDFVTVSGGSFALVFPQDAHMPSMAIGAPSFVKKIVVKIAVE